MSPAVCVFVPRVTDEGECRRVSLECRGTAGITARASGGESTRRARDEYSLCSVFIIINRKAHVRIKTVIQFDRSRVRVSFWCAGRDIWLS